MLMWMFEGFGIKFLDQIIDEGKEPPKWVSNLILISLGIVAGFTMNIDKFSLSVSIALILGLIFANKVDSKVWYTLIILILASYSFFFVFFFISDGINTFDLIPILILVVMVLILSYLDEFSHDHLNNIQNLFLKNVLDRRLLMKIGVILLFFIFDFVFWYHIVAWMLFDIMYDLTGFIYNKKKTINSNERT